MNSGTTGTWQQLGPQHNWRRGVMRGTTSARPSPPPPATTTAWGRRLLLLLLLVGYALMLAGVLRLLLTP